MSRYLSWFCVVFAALMSSAAGAQTIAISPPDSAVVSEPLTPLAPPMSITQRYVPAKAPRAPLALLIDDSPAVAARPVGAVQPTVAEEVGERPAIAALAPGRLAITVSTRRSGAEGALIPVGRASPAGR